MEHYVFLILKSNSYYLFAYIWFYISLYFVFFISIYNYFLFVLFFSHFVFFNPLSISCVFFLFFMFIVISVGIFLRFAPFWAKVYPTQRKVTQVTTQCMWGGVDFVQCHCYIDLLVCSQWANKFSFSLKWATNLLILFLRAPTRTNKFFLVYLPL